jgi:hypothetical protein
LPDACLAPDCEKAFVLIGRNANGIEEFWYSQMRKGFRALFLQIKPLVPLRAIDFSTSRIAQMLAV